MTATEPRNELRPLFALPPRRLENILDTHSTRKAADLASKPTSVRRIRVLLGRIGMLDSRKVVIRRRAAENYGDHLIDFGSVRRIDGQLLRDRRGRVVIFLTDHSLQSIREAVFTIGHELKHIKDFLAGLENSAEAAANAAGDEFLKQFLNILLRGTK